MQPPHGKVRGQIQSPNFWTRSAAWRKDSGELTFDEFMIRVIFCVSLHKVFLASPRFVLPPPPPPPFSLSKMALPQMINWGYLLIKRSSKPRIDVKAPIWMCNRPLCREGCWAQRNFPRIFMIGVSQRANNKLARKKGSGLHQKKKKNPQKKWAGAYLRRLCLYMLTKRIVRLHGNWFGLSVRRR